jgi:hypothetical protein
MSFQKIDKDSANSISSALDFFTVPSTNTTVQNSTWREYLPLNPVSDIPYHFKIHSSNNFLDLSKVYLLSEMRIQSWNTTDNVWKKLASTELPSTINYIGSTFIKNLKVAINGREIYDSNSLYAFKTYLNTKLSFPKTVKNAYFNAAGYYELESHDDTTDDSYDSRRDLFKLNGTKEAVGQFLARLDADIFNQPNYMLSGTEIDIEIIPNDSNFTIMQGSTDSSVYRLEIIGLKLYVKALELMDSLALDITRKLESIPARYAIKRTTMLNKQLASGITEFSHSISSDQIPRRIVCALVTRAAYSGDKNLSPFNFKHFGVRELTIFANNKSYPASLYNLDYDTNKYVRAFNDLHEALGLANSTESNGITLEKYKKGWAIYCFNLTNSQEESDCFDLIKEGSTEINIKFKTAIPTGGAALIVLQEFDSLIFIDKNRNIVTDYSI